MTYRTTTMRLAAVCLIAFGLVGAGCSSLSNTEKGAATGAGAGAVIGGVIGNATGSTARGAIIGAAAGGVAGAVIGRQMDQQAEELDEELGEGATVATIEDPETGETAGINVTFDGGILFNVDSDNLQPGAQTDLAQLAQTLQEYPNTDVLIVGHTDATGSDQYNMSLSQRRAQSAASYLLRQGVPSDRLTTLGKGETEPVATNETATGRQLNRRVEVAIFPNERAVEQQSLTD